MTDPTSGPVPRCPWCSAALPAPGIERCPSCGAQLVTVPGSETEIRGVTTLDAEAILRARSELNRPRTRLLSLITGDEVEAASAREHQESLAQPSDEVRREMLRLEAEARQAAEDAERTALRAAAMAELGITVDDLAAAEAAEMAGHAGEGIAGHAGAHAGAHADADAHADTHADAHADARAGDPGPGAEAAVEDTSGVAGKVVPGAAAAVPDAAENVPDAAETVPDAVETVPDAAGSVPGAVEGTWPEELQPPDEPSNSADPHGA